MEKHPVKFAYLNAPETVAGFLADSILKRLKLGQKVLWLVPGGSAMNVAVEAAQEISVSPHDGLIVTLTDERYGDVGHADSNWQQLQESGFSLPEAKLIPILTSQGFRETAQAFQHNLQAALDEADYAIGLFGIGIDGHTAGILPHSPAVSDAGLVSAYEAGNFKRITITPRAIVLLDEAVVFARGEAKWPTLGQLGKPFAIADQPAQALKALESLTIFTDYKN